MDWVKINERGLKWKGKKIGEGERKKKEIKTKMGEKSFKNASYQE